MIELIQQTAKNEGKNIHAECLDIDDNKSKEVSIFTNLLVQVEKYCAIIQQHPVFSKSNINVIGMSQGGMLSRYIVEHCDLGQYKVHNYLSLAGPQ